MKPVYKHHVLYLFLTPLLISSSLYTLIKFAGYRVTTSISALPLKTAGKNLLINHPLTASINNDRGGG